MPSTTEHDYLRAFLGRLRHALELRGMSQADLARHLGVRQATVSDWFNQNRAPSGLNMLRLPEILKVSSGWLFSGEGSTDEPPSERERWEGGSPASP